MIADRTLAPLAIAVVGHTNTGKTSLLRTLLRDTGFGTVSNQAATTREVEAGELRIDGALAATLVDTPGLEDSSGLLEHLEAIKTETGSDWTDAIHSFLRREEQAASEFAQEAKALRQVLQTDLAFYVIDARDPVRGKHRDELEILARCARPIVPVLNFVADNNTAEADWRQQLARVNMHAIVAFDTVVVNELSELDLFEKARSLLDSFAPTLTAILDDIRHRRDDLRRASARLIKTLVDTVIGMQKSVAIDDESGRAQAIAQLKEEIRVCEQRAVAELLALHRFQPGDYLPDRIPLEEGKWQRDLFDAASLVDFGLSTGGAAATGAMAGLAIDVVFGGLTLGAAALAGATVGALTNVLGSKGGELLDKVRGHAILQADATTLELLVVRQLALARALLRRGHASQTQLQTPAPEKADHDTAVSVRKILQRQRNRPQWLNLVSDLASPANSEIGGENDSMALLYNRLSA